MNLATRHQGLKRAVVKLFAGIRLQSHGVASSGAFQDAVERRGHCHARLALQRFHPRDLGQHIHHRQQIAHPPIPFFQRLHLHQVGHPLVVHPMHHHRQGREPSSSRFVQGVTQQPLQFRTGTTHRHAVRLRQTRDTPQTPAQRGRFIGVRPIHAALLLLPHVARTRWNHDKTQ